MQVKTDNIGYIVTKRYKAWPILENVFSSKINPDVNNVRCDVVFGCFKKTHRDGIQVKIDNIEYIVTKRY
jgi:hypothetical protein